MPAKSRRVDTSGSMRLFVVTGTLGVEHMVLARSTGHAVQVVTKAFSISPEGLGARMLASDLTEPRVIRSDYPEEDRS
jgi:hypothetical protein